MQVNERVLSIADLEEHVRRLRAGWRRPEPTVVLMNGCFDLLHPGHVNRLMRAMDWGWHLVVAVDTDERVAELKGAGRPIRPWADRATTVAAVRGVWRVTSVGAGTCLAHVMDAIRPALYVVRPGGTGDEAAKVDEAQALERRIPVLILPLHGDWSTSRELAKIRQQWGEADG